MKKEVLIVGGGITGLSLAWELSCLGIDSILVEKAPFLGGHVSQFTCKATDTCQKCGACLLEDYLSKLSRISNFPLLINSRIDSFDEVHGKFKTLVFQGQSKVINEKCDDCGLCQKVCPVDGALFHAAFDSKLYLSNEKCINALGVHCEACAQICPQGAIDLQESRDIEIETSSIAVCSGFTPFDASQKPRLGFQRTPGVFTTLEIDSLLRSNNFQPVLNQEELKSIAFVQCVGSRDPKSGANYCSQICCGVSVRLARLLKSRYPDLEITIFYMDIQTFERHFDETMRQAAKDMTFIRSMPSEIRTGENGKPEIVYQGNDDVKQSIPYDMIVLSIGIRPGRPDLPRNFPAMWKNREGFIGSDDQDVAAGHPGIFVAGTAQGPKSITNCVSQAIFAASRIKRYLDRTKKGEFK